MSDDGSMEQPVDTVITPEHPLKALARAIKDAMEAAEINSLARQVLVTRYGVPDDDEHVRVDRAEIVDKVLYIHGSVMQEAPNGFLDITITTAAD